VDGENSLDVTPYHPVVTLPYNVTGRSAVSNGMYFTNVDACVAYINRLKQAAHDLDWLLLLEDDVWVCDMFHATALKYDMNGRCAAYYDKARWGDLTPGPCYGGCGGFVLRGQFLRHMQVDSAYIQSILVKIQRPLASDELLSALFLRSNGTIGWTDDYAEAMPFYPVIVHRMKAFYRQDTTCSFMDELSQ
jgi:hypothetical protein